MRLFNSLSLLPYILQSSRFSSLSSLVKFRINEKAQDSKKIMQMSSTLARKCLNWLKYSSNLQFGDKSDQKFTKPHNYSNNLIEEMKKNNDFLKRAPTKKLVICNENRSSFTITPLIFNNRKTHFTPELSKETLKSKQKDALSKQKYSKTDKIDKQSPSNNPKKQTQNSQKVQHFGQSQLKLLPNTRNRRSNSEMLSKCARFSKKSFFFPSIKLKNKSQFDAEIEQIYKITADPIADLQNSAIVMAQKQIVTQVLTLFVKMLSQNESFFQKNDISCKQELRLICSKICISMKACHNKKKGQKLVLHKAYKYTIFPDDLNMQKNSQERNLSRLLDQNQKLQQKNCLNQLYLKNVSQIIMTKQIQLVQTQRKTNQLQETINIQNLRVEGLSESIAEKESLLSKLKVKALQILNFVEVQQEKKILDWVSQAYKKIQAEIYDYACFLQCNSMASSLTWEPKPFRAVQKWVYEQMERVNTYIASKAESVEDKAARMREFVTNTTRKFRTKDQEMTKITDFKTECIKKFTGMMHKWLENWELKQQYLVSLRSQFAVQSEEINHLLLELEFQVKDIDRQVGTKKIQALLDSLKHVWSKVVLNYKYGNSFY